MLDVCDVRVLKSGLPAECLGYIYTQVPTVEKPDYMCYLKHLLMSVGNPGIAQYYADFMQELHKYCHVPMHCVSHAGHVNVQQPVSQCESLTFMSQAAQ